MKDNVQSKRNLVVLTIGVFIVSMSLSEVTPFLSLYIAGMGHFTKSSLGIYSGIAYAAAFFAMAISSPFWGKLADRSGRRVMLIRAALGMCIAFTLMGMATNKFKPRKKEELTSGKEFLAKMANRKLIISLFITTMVIQMINLSINPIVSLYVKQLMSNKGNIALMAGIVSAAPGIATALTAPIFGRIGDQIGAEKMLLFGFSVAFFIQLGTSFVTTIFMLIVMRFLIGFSNATMLPSVNSLLTRYTRQDDISRVFAYNQSFMSLGAMIGPLIGSFISGVFDYRGIFLASAFLVLINILINLFSQKEVNKS